MCAVLGGGGGSVSLCCPWFLSVSSGGDWMVHAYSILPTPNSFVLVLNHLTSCLNLMKISQVCVIFHMEPFPLEEGT